MNFLLKIVEGPNKGAEIALVEGVAVTLGKGDDCDIVLADGTMPDDPLRLEARDGSVMAASVSQWTADGGMEPLEPLHVKTVGATSFAVGPADAAWGELVWPGAGNEGREAGKGEEEKDKKEEGKGKREEEPAADGGGRQPPKDGQGDDGGRRGGRRGCVLGCLVALALLLVLAVVAWWLLRGGERDGGLGRVAHPVFSRLSRTDSPEARDTSGQEKPASLEDIAGRYGLTLENSAAGAALSGNLRTRVDRLRATAEAYGVQPGVSLDLSDDESFLAAAEDALFTLSEGALKAVSATNRVLSIAGASPSPFALRKVLDALNADLPKIRDVDVSGVRMDPLARLPGVSGGEPAAAAPAAPRAVRPAQARSPGPNLPVCGILTVPYPCLVLKNGARVLEGASIGDSVILKIEADSVVLTNSTGRFTWRP
jgi:hypothetical protein